MQVHHNKRDIKADVASFLKENKTIGFVPTMGALHQGHLALVKEALDNNDIVIVSIFVNPTQFNNPKDLEKYPRTLESDINLLSDLDKNIIVFCPTSKDIYGDSPTAIHYDFGGIEHEMEGKFRPGHFDGVGTIIKYLFEIVSPHKAYFGEKDFQQLQIIRKLVEIEKLSVEIIGCQIYREQSGLAFSSRNKRLSPTQLKESPLIYNTLIEIKNNFGTKSVVSLKNWIEEQFKNNVELELEYFEIADSSTLKSITKKEENKKYRAFIAAFAGDVRLIDNIALN